MVPVDGVAREWVLWDDADGFVRVVCFVLPVLLADGELVAGFGAGPEEVCLKFGMDDDVVVFVGTRFSAPWLVGTGEPAGTTGIPGETVLAPPMTPGAAGKVFPFP